MRISSAVSGNNGTSHRNRNVAAMPPVNCAAINAGASAGLMPENVSETARASVTAGLANDVDDVNQYAAVIYAPTAKGTELVRTREHPHITAIKPNVATNS